MAGASQWDAPSSLTTSVADWIAAGIISGRWSAGDRLREIEVCEELGVSRAPVREAIRMLHEKGLVRHVPRIGAVINHFSTETVIDVYEMRAVIEQWIYQQSVPALEQDDLEQLDRLLTGMDEARAVHDYSTFFDLGWTFRQTLHSGSTNAVALELVDQLRARLHSLPQVLRDDDQHVAATSDAYRKMRDAAVRGDGEAVGAVVHEFMLAVGARVCERYALASQRLGDDLKRIVQ
ncbi:MAG TPA: GntR family transcriptional regulator [Cellulomonas sp.]